MPFLKTAPLKFNKIGKINKYNTYMFVQFLNTHPFMSPPVEIILEPHRGTKYVSPESDEEESSDEETFFG